MDLLIREFVLEEVRDSMKYVDPKQYDFSRLNEEQLKVAVKDDTIFDTKFETKPVGYLKDAAIRFAKNKGSLVAGIVLMILVTFAIFGPLMSPWQTDQTQDFYRLCLPKVHEASNGFWDGTEMKTEPEKTFIYDNSRGAVVGEAKKGKVSEGVQYYTYRCDTYVKGYIFKDFSEEEYNAVLDYQNKTGKQVLFPLLDTSYNIDPYTGMPKSMGIEYQHQDANNYYQIDKSFNPIFDAEGKIIPIYEVDGEGNYVFYHFNGANYEVRINYDAYYIMLNGKAPMYYFGSDGMGRDIFTRLWHGARLSLLLGVGVSLINIILGVIYGAIEGYYGGKADLIMERISDILVEIPSLILLTLFQIYFASKWGPVPALLLAFVLTGWIGTASRVRMQFYRFKNQEYVLAARVLGAKDRRIIFRHILPNAIGTLITSVILMIPGVIFSESTLSFLNIIDLETGTMTSIGTMLAAGQDLLDTHPHVLLFPAIFISILMISFNLFGNGLRDAFNPSLRGVEE